MFDIGLGEIIVLAALALLVFGPDQLPKAAAQAGRFVRDLRAMAASARKELGDSADLDGIGDDLKSLADLHPKRILTSVWEDPDPSGPAAKPPAASAGPVTPATRPASAPPPTSGGQPPSTAAGSAYDPDAT